MPEAMNLRGVAQAVAAECGHKGAVVITLDGEGAVRIGVENLTPAELREALCTAVHYSYVFEGDDFGEGAGPNAPDGPV
jgi:hypothetical protein